MAQQVLKESQLPDGSYQYILSEQTTRADWILFILLCAAVISSIILIFVIQHSAVVLFVILLVAGGKGVNDRTSLHLTFTDSEFVLERGIAGNKLFVYRLPLHEIKEFEYAPAIAFLSWFKAPLRHNFATSYSRRSLFEAFRYAVGLRDTKNRQYMVNVRYGTAAERKQLTDMLNERLSSMKNDQE